MPRRSRRGRRKGRPAARSGRRVVWVKGHCRRRPEGRIARKTRVDRDMPF